MQTRNDVRRDGVRVVARCLSARALRIMTVKENWEQRKESSGTEKSRATKPREHSGERECARLKKILLRLTLDGKSHRRVCVCVCVCNHDYI